MPARRFVFFDDNGDVRNLRGHLGCPMRQCMSIFFVLDSAPERYAIAHAAAKSRM